MIKKCFSLIFLLYCLTDTSLAGDTSDSAIVHAGTDSGSSIITNSKQVLEAQDFPWSTFLAAIHPPVMPNDSCEAPASLYDVSSPTSVVGSGTAGSCTQASLQTAADIGGTIIFNCGASPVTITVTSPIIFKKRTVLDGRGQITLSGGGTSRILYLDSGYDQTTPRLVVQRLTFRDGNSPRGGADTAMGGGAIYRDGGSLTVVNSTFLNNLAPSPGQDIAGGAIYAFGGGNTIIVNSTFLNNQASNGGAIGSLNGDIVIADSSFQQNAATGTDGNPGNGGCGGAIYMDGADERTELCGVKIINNTAGAIGGGFFRVSNNNSGTFSLDKSTVDSNTVTASGKGNAGGLYLQGLDMNLTASTISRNQAWYNGGIWIHTSEVQMLNVTIAENVATGSNGGGMWLSSPVSGTLLNCTIANNHADAYRMGAGAVFGGGPALVLKNTLISGNTGWWGPNCHKLLGEGGQNLQWTGSSPCTSNINIADPVLGSLGSHGGPTETMLPSSNSPARKSGSGCPEKDQRGKLRSAKCTIGATE